MYPDRKKYLLDLVEATFRSITAKLNLIFQEHLKANLAHPLGDIITSGTVCNNIIYIYFLFLGDMDGTTCQIKMLTI